MIRADPTLRVQSDADDAAVRRAHVAQARWAPLATASWPAETIAALHDAQYRAHEQHLAAGHSAAERLMIIVGGDAVGRLVIDRGMDPWHLVDLTLVPEAQGGGIGTAVLARLFGEAARAGAGVVLEVGHDNPRAEAFYRRLGFVDAGDGDALQKRLRWGDR